MIDPNDFAALTANARAYHDQQQQAARQVTQVAPTKPQGKGNFLTHLLPSIGGTAGGIGGGALLGGEIGTALLPGIGTAGGALLGALLGGATGGAAGKVAENKIEGNAMGNGVVGAGIENGVLSAGPLRLLKGAGAVTKAGGEGLLGALAKPVMAHGAETVAADVAGQGAKDTAQTVLKTSAAGKLDDFGIKQLGKQLGPLGDPEIRAYDPYNTIKSLSNAGLTKDTDWERTANAITGSNGLMNKAVVKAVGTTGTVPTAGIKDTLENSIVDRNLSGLSQETAARKFVEGQLTKLGDNPTAPQVLESMKRLEKQVRDLEGAGGNFKRADPTRGDIANVYRDIHQHLEDSLYKGAGANDNVQKVLTPELQQQLLSINPNNAKWAAHVSNIMDSKTVNELRGAQKPFVNISNMIDHSRNKAFSASSRGVSAMENGTAPTFQGMMIGTGTKLAKGPLARVSGNMARTLSGSQGEDVALKNGTSSLASALAGPSAKQIIRNEALLGVPLNSIPDANAQGTATTDPNTVHYEDGTTATIDPTTGQPTTTGAAGTSGASTAPTSLTSALSATAPASNSPFDAANVPGNIQKLLQSGGTMKDVTAYLDMAKTVQEMQAASAPAQPKALNSTQQQQSFNAQSGLTSLQDIAAALQKNPNEAKLAALPGGGLTASLTGTGSYKAAIANASDVIGRLRSGGAIGQQEEKQFKALLPQTFDTPQTAAYKLNQLQTLFAQFANPQAAAADTSQLTAGAF